MADPSWFTGNLTPDQVQQIIAAGQAGTVNIGGINYGAGGVVANSQDGGGFTPQEILGYQPGAMGAGAIRSQFGLNGQYIGMGQNEAPSIKDGLLAFGAMALMAFGLPPSFAAEAAGGEPLVGDAISKAALDGTSAFGANSVPGAFDLSSAAGGAGGAGGAAAFNPAVDSQLASSQLGLTAADTAGGIPSVTVNAAAGTPGALTGGGDAITQAVQNAVQSGSPLQSAMQSVSSATGLPLSSIAKMLGAAGNAVGNALLGNGGLGNLINVGAGLLQAGAAKEAANELAGGAETAANILSPAYTNAANTLAGGYTQQGNLTSQGLLQGGQTIADAYKTAAGQEVAGLNNAQGAVDRTLAAQEGIQAPYQQAGQKALATLSDGLAPGGRFNTPFSMADMENVMPAYTFARDEALEAMRNQMSAGGQGLGTNALEGAGKTAAGLASQFEGQAFNQWLAANNMSLGALQQMVSTGQTSTAQLQQALAQAGFSSQQIQTAIGAVQGNASIGAGNAMGQAQAGAGAAQGNAALGAAGAQSQGILGSAGAQSSAAMTEAKAKAAGTIGTANAFNGLLGNFGNNAVGTNALTTAQGRPFTMGSGSGGYTLPTFSMSSYNDNPYVFTNPYDGSYGFGSGSNYGNEDLGINF